MVFGLISFSSNRRIYGERSGGLKLYEWEHLKNPSPIRHRELLDLLMAFTTSAAYRYFVEIRKSADTSLKTVLDVEFTSDDPQDTASESFNVVTPKAKP